ncbi:CehA/McbA family metallohydrolase [Sphingomonas sp.]|uniref:CehA/McbA family metallohydrolase n=1 Tax=Sphingomonas sp. TaxID=28214 RepID=UPI003B3B06E0
MGLFPIILAAAAQALPAPPADLTFSGQVTAADHQHYRQIPFDVPPGVERVTIVLDYDKSNKTVIDLGLWDNQRFRGWSGGARDRFTVAPSDASPGYLPGAILPGRWHVELGIPNARANSHSGYRLRVFFDRDADRRASSAIADAPLRAAPDWYRGDLHMHDANSDGSCASASGRRVPCPLFRTVAAAAQAGLDFIAVTDHNTVSHFGGLRELQPYFDRTLLIPGTEITTFHGHANAIGQQSFLDFRVGTPDVPNIVALERAVARAGAILTINHPNLPSGETCMGCGWTWPDTDYTGITAIEAVNGSIAEGAYAGLGFWYARLNEGHRLTGVGGSDNHDSDPDPKRAPVGRPTTVVHALALSTPAILAGIRAGNVFIDVAGTRDRLLEVEASSGSSRAVMGGSLHLARTIAIEAQVQGVADGQAVLIVDGKASGEPQPIDTARRSARFAIDAASVRRWISVNILGAGHPLLIGNPIYIDRR